MTIDEAIDFYKGYNDRSGGTVDYNEFDEQIAEWLEELKALKNGLNIKCDKLNEALEKGKKLGYNKAIDDFVKFASNIQQLRKMMEQSDLCG